MALKAVKLIYVISRWIDDTYDSLLVGGNIKEDVWWITTRVMSYVYEDYLYLARSTANETYFDAYSQCRSI